MAATAAQIVAKIQADITGFQQGMAQARDETEKQKGFFATTFGEIAKTAAGFLAAAGIQMGLQQIVGTMKDWISSAIQAQQNQAALNAVLASTHDAVGMSADQINAMVQSLKNLTGVDDDVILQGTNMLLTFTNIGKTVFPEANQAMEDMAVAMNHGSLQGLDMKDTAIQLGKALNDPINGISALSRVGVTFTQQQKDQIKAMVAAGDTAGAQKVILQELEKEFGGAAAAAGNSDPFNRFSLAMGDVGKAVGGLVLPLLTALMTNVLTPMANWLLNNLAPAWQALQDAMKPVGELLGDVWGDVSILFEPFQNLNLSLGDLVTTIQTTVGAAFMHLHDWFHQASDDSAPVWQVFSGIAEGIKGLMTDLGGAGKGFDFSGIVTQFQNLGQVIITQVLPNIQQFAGWFQKTMLPAIQQFMPHLISFAQFIVNNVVPAFIQLYTHGVQIGAVIQKTLLPVFETLAPIVMRIAGFLLDMGQKALGFLLPKIEQAAKAISEFATEMSTRLGPFIQHLVTDIQEAATVIGDVWGFLWPWMSGILKVAWDLISGIIQIAWDIITGIFKIGADILSGNWSQLWTDIQGMADSVKQTVIGIVQGLWDDLKGLWDAGTTMIHDVWSSVWNGLAGIAASAWDGVKGAIRNGINGAIDLINQMIRLADNVPGVNISQIGHVNFAFGGEMPYSGVARVGDAGGPEYAFFPKGTQTVSASDAKRYMQQGAAGGGAGGMHVHIHGVIDAGLISQVVGLELKKVMLQHGF